MKHEQPAVIEKNPAAVALGRLGGAAGRGTKRGFAAMTPAKRRALGKKGASAKWDKEKAN